MKYFSIVLLFLISCVKPNEVSPLEIIGEWKYVGLFSDLVDYKCLVCPEYDYENEKYQINFMPNGDITAKVNLLILKGKYTTDKEKVKILEFQRQNKPFETSQDADFINYFMKADIFSVYSLNKEYQSLKLNISKESFMLFVRK